MVDYRPMVDNIDDPLAALYSYCTDFSRILKPKIENGDPKTGKGPYGDPDPKMGTHLGAVLTCVIC